MACGCVGGFVFHHQNGLSFFWWIDFTTNMACAFRGGYIFTTKLACGFVDGSFMYRQNGPVNFVVDLFLCAAPRGPADLMVNFVSVYFSH